MTEATLTLENIGKHQGTREYMIRSGTVTQFKGPNSSGKTTILKSIALALSSPIQKKNTRGEAVKMGIFPTTDGKASPLLNINEEKAAIHLKWGKQNADYVLTNDGGYRTNYSGNENFLLAGLLLENSKVPEYLAKGFDDFSWIVSDLSLASAYESMLEIIEDYQKRAAATRGSISAAKEQQEKIAKEISVLKAKIASLQGSLKEGGALTSEASPEAEIKKRQKKETDLYVKECQAKIQAFEAQIKKKEKELVDYNKKIDQNRKKIATLKETIGAIANLSKLRELTKLNDLRKRLQPLIEERAALLQHKGFQKAVANAKADCPVCFKDSSDGVDSKKVKETLKSLDKGLGSLDPAIDRLNGEIQESESNLNKIRKLAAKQKELAKLRTELQNLQLEFGSNPDDIAALNEKLALLQANLAKKLPEVKKLEAELQKISVSAGEIPAAAPQIELERQVSNLIGQVEVNERLLRENESVRVFESQILVNDAEGILADLEAQLKAVIAYLLENIQSQRGDAASRFNASVKNLLGDLNLEDFDQVLLDPVTFKLQIKRKSGRSQPVSSLNGNERALIATVLQLACKQTFLPDVPFFLGDDVLKALDNEIYLKVINRLKKLAQEKDQFVIVAYNAEKGDLRQEQL